MIARWLALAALVVAGPAQAADRAVWAGVWEGRIGTLPIRACMEAFQGDEDGSGRGSYYYLSKLQPIRLGEVLTEDPTWAENAETPEEATWEFATLGATTASGVWRQGKRTLPLTLRAVAWQDVGEMGPCGSTAFLAPVLAGGTVQSQPAMLSGWRYTRMTYTPPARLKDAVGIETFSYKSERPGDVAILAKLASELPKETPEDDLFGCFAGNLSAQGVVGDYSVEVTPRMATPQFLTVRYESADYCGGAHPNYNTYHKTFDRGTGGEVNVGAWLGTPGEYDTVEIPPRLRTAALAKWSRDAEAECKEAAGETDYWDFGLVANGVELTPSMPHAMKACEEPSLMTWAELAPYLTAVGKAGVALVRTR